VEEFYRLELDLVADVDVVPRIVATCHQRGCRIVALRYDQSASESMVLVIKTQNQGGRTLALKLANLVHVLAVRAQLAQLSPGSVSGLI
jgi:acetolactate synthase regulatory subunit